MEKRLKAIIKDGIRESIRVKREILENPEDIIKIIVASKSIIESYKKGGQLILFGNGGSAADAQHIEGELVNKLYIPNRPMLNARALTVNTSVLTAIGNDSSYENIFARQISSLVKSIDVVMGISTSGNSINVIKGIEAAKEQKAYTIALTGKSGGKLSEISDLLINVPGTDVARIQEAHILVGHLICESIERILFQEFKPAVFLDRDGVIVHDAVGYVNKVEDLKFIEGTIEGMKKLQDKYKLIILTNQAGIAKAKFKTEDYEKFTANYERILKEEGVNVGGIYYCPHHPKGTVAEYAKDCYCRKPSLGMLEKAIREHNIDVDHSYVIGDKNSDLRLTKYYSSLKAIAVLSGEGTTEEFERMEPQPYAICKDLYEASKIILKEHL